MAYKSKSPEAIKQYFSLYIKEHMPLIPIRILVLSATIRRQIPPGQWDLHHPAIVVCNKQYDKFTFDKWSYELLI